MLRPFIRNSSNLLLHPRCPGPGTRTGSSLVGGLSGHGENLLHPSLKYDQHWEPVIGLEIHAQIWSKSKLFSGASTAYQSTPNSNVAFFDCSLPGTLPVINRRCVEAAVLTGLALNCTVSRESWFDRKHYFYADLPFGYQITQQREPIAANGYIDFLVYQQAVHKKAYKRRSILKQIQLEQDSGKSLHDEVNHRSLIDLNRAGIGLMELVFEPDLSDGEEAAALVKDLILILQKLGTCSCKLEEGSLRVDANVSVRRPNEPLGTRSEVKNLNSLKSISKAIDYEIKRQINLLESGDKVVNETRMYSAERQETVVMRDKEVVLDYRFMPEPNLPGLRLIDTDLEEGADAKNRGILDVATFRKMLPQLPEEERNEMVKKYGLDLEQALLLVSEPELAQFFYKVMAEKPTRDALLCFKVLTFEVLGILRQNKLTLDTSPLDPSIVGECVDLMQEGKTTLGTTFDVLTLIVQGNPSRPQEMVEKFGWHLIQGEEELTKICQQAIKDCPQKAKSYAKKGKKYAIEILVKYVQDYTQKRVDYKTAKDMFDKLLKPPKTNKEKSDVD